MIAKHQTTDFISMLWKEGIQSFKIRLYTMKNQNDGIKNQRAFNSKAWKMKQHVQA